MHPPSFPLSSVEKCQRNDRGQKRETQSTAGVAMSFSTMRFFITGGGSVALVELARALHASSEGFAIVEDGKHAHFGQVMLGDERFGDIELLARGDQDFTDELDDLLDALPSGDDDEVAAVRAQLDKAEQMVLVERRWEGAAPDLYLERATPLWAWLFAHRQGLLQVDHDGYYQGDTCVLELA